MKNISDGPIKLKVYWGNEQFEKKKQLIFSGPNGPDRRLIASILSKAACKELEARGYNIATLKFSIERNKIHGSHTERS